jgi:hypothetical protein
MENAQDLLLLSAYIDQALSPDEQAALEARLLREPDLQAELDSLRATVAQLKALPRLKAPRNYTLDPAQFAPRPIMQKPPRRAVYTPPMWIRAAAAMVVAVVGLGLLLTQLNPQAETETQNIAQEAAQQDENSAAKSPAASPTSLSPTQAEVALLPAATLPASTAAMAATSPPLPTASPAPSAEVAAVAMGGEAAAEDVLRTMDADLAASSGPAAEPEMEVGVMMGGVPASPPGFVPEMPPNVANQAPVPPFFDDYGGYGGGNALGGGFGYGFVGDYGEDFPPPSAQIPAPGSASAATELAMSAIWDRLRAFLRGGWWD